MDDGDEKITDPEELKQIRRKAMSIHWKSILVAVVFAGLMALIGRR
jgi:hypothetical protein